MVVSAQNARGILKPHRPQVFQQRVNRRGPVTTAATHRITDAHDDAGVAAGKDLLILHLVGWSGDECVDKGLGVERR